MVENQTSAASQTALKKGRSLRRLFVEGLDLPLAASAIDGFEHGSVTASGSGVSIEVEATEDEYARLRVELDERAAIARVEAAVRQQQEADRQKHQFVEQLTGLWQPTDGTFSGGPAGTQTLVVLDGHVALYEKNQRERLWRLQVNDLGVSPRIALVPLDGQPGMQGVWTRI